ncbi:MAG: serine hydrolase [Saprospiraceae bacterium]|nr:serine hydrolase [Saprospiraceae bacterium]
MRSSTVSLLLGGFFFLNSLSVKAQGVPPTLDSLLQATLDQQQLSLNVKALSAAIQFPDGSVWAGAAGFSSEFPFVKADTSMVFGIASITKTVTAGCIMQMADDGLLGLDDSLHQWLDTFPHINPNITIRQLLRHQSGIYDVLSAPNFQPTLLADPDSIWQLADVIRTFISVPDFQPGSGFKYSNTNYILLGMIAEEVAGQPYYTEFRERLLAPLGLGAFSMRPFEPNTHPVAHAWYDFNGDGTVESAHNLLSTWHSFDAATGPAGSYYATASDVARWVRALVGGSVLSPAMLAQAKMTVNSGFPANTKYGLGLMERNFLGNKAYGHGGDFVYSGSAWYFPEKDKSIVVLNNDGSKSSWQIAPAVQALLKTCLDYEMTLSAPLADNVLRMEVFPNPFSDAITLQTDLAVDWVLRNTLGETLRSGHSANPAGDRIAGLDSLPPGLYLLECYTEGKSLGIQKLLKNEG